MILRWTLFVALSCMCLPVSGRELRVLTYNIHHAEGRDSRFDLQRIASVIRAARPDLVALQELDQGTTRSGEGVFQLAELAQLTEMQGFFGKTFPYAGGEYGNGVLVGPELDVTVVERRPLPNPAGGEERGVTQLGLSIDEDPADAEFEFFATHLSVDGAANRTAQANFINELAANSPLPAIVAGDLNARPSSKPMRLFFEVWQDASDATNSGISRNSQIDYVLIRRAEQWQVVEPGRFVINETTSVASDHYPLLTVIEYTPPSGDVDADGDVDGADFMHWQRGLGGVVYAGGDANRDGSVNGADLAIWASQFGAQHGSEPSALSEPSSN